LEPQSAVKIAKSLAAAMENPQEPDSDWLLQLGNVLAALANRMEPQAAVEIARGLAAALENPQETDSARLSRLGEALAALVNRMEPQSAVEIARGLAAAMEDPQETDSDRLSRLGTALGVLTNRMESQAAAEIASRGAQRLAVAMENPQQTDSDRLSRLGEALAALANRMEPQAAAEIASRGAQRLAALEKLKERRTLNREPGSSIPSPGEALAALANRLEPQAAAEIARGLAVAMEDPQETDSHRLSSLGEALAALANRMEPQAAAKIASRGAQRLAAAFEDSRQTDYFGFGPSRLGEALAALANRLEPQAAAEIARGLAAAMENPQQTDSHRLSGLGNALMAVSRLLPAHRTHLLALSNMLLQPVSEEAAESKEQPNDWKLLADVCAQLPTEDLVEALKFPFCTGEAEQIVLDQLNSKSHQDFGGDVWKFVEQADSLGIKDIGSPAKRPSVQEALNELNKL
jgi:hypothetical protein